MLFKKSKKWAEFVWLWEIIFTVKRSFFNRLITAMVIASVCFCLIFLIHYKTGLFFSSLIQITVILIVFYSGFFIGLSLAVILSILADYYFIPPIGGIFNSTAGNDEFIIIILIAFFAATLASTIKAAFQKAAIAKKEAEEATAMMEKVLALVVHDIRNPLTAIRLGAQLILRNPDQEEKQLMVLTKMIKTIDHTDSIIKSLLDIASIKAGKTISLEFLNCDLSSQLGQMVEEMSNILSESLVFIPNDPIWGEWGVDGIHRALENLITNAIKYGEPNTPIVIKLIKEEQWAVISVHNIGKEISLEEQSKLFESYHRTDKATNVNITGWGLGLSLVKAVAEAHGGKVLVESGKEIGTTFTLKLPIQNRSHNPQQV